MNNTTFHAILQSEPYKPAAYLKGIKHYEIILTENESTRLKTLHESRTIVLNALMEIDAKQDEIRQDIKRRTGIDGIIYFRNGNLF